MKILRKEVKYEVQAVRNDLRLDRNRANEPVRSEQRRDETISLRDIHSVTPSLFFFFLLVFSCVFLNFSCFYLLRSLTFRVTCSTEDKILL